jgi:hypothetical protein
LRQRLTIFVGSVEPAEIGAFAGFRVGDEERHAALLRERAAAEQREEGDGGGCGESAGDGYCSSRFLVDQGRTLRRPRYSVLALTTPSQGRVHSRECGNPDDRAVALDSGSRFARPE